ncbi:hypothetical protein RBWH47_00186 [Rhodopirellula baltica WH47]|uniref:Uncharacterized protein n=1 Tax=Rhodopirellula baltica WH47 TaxID=991778 RepID=F2AR46_RHOBT|nr:hypothetical protein RBWH47_00186 [Rhodopirellula baltica WH47]
MDTTATRSRHRLIRFHGNWNPAFMRLALLNCIPNHIHMGILIRTIMGIRMAAGIHIRTIPPILT